MEEKNITERESLAIITQMIGKAKGSFNETGASAILWGSVVPIAAFVSFAQKQWNFSIGFDIWLLILAAVIPQLWFIRQEAKRKMVKTHAQAACDVIWLVYGISLVALILYGIFVPDATAQTLADNNLELFSKNTLTGEIQNYRVPLPSISSIYLIIYAFPTIATGLICKFRPMLYGAIACYLFFIISLFVPFKYDMLLSAFAGIGNWLIPGLIMQKKYRKARMANV